MGLRRICAMLVLAVMALWAAAPVFACAESPAPQDCCRGMMPDCGAQAMGTDSSCCQLRSSVPLSAVDRAPNPEQSPNPTPFVCVASAIGPDSLSLRRAQRSETPPRRFPGSISNLRI
jgi:hypothetical protein